MFNVYRSRQRFETVINSCRQFRKMCQVLLLPLKIVCFFPLLQSSSGRSVCKLVWTLWQMTDDVIVEMITFWNITKKPKHPSPFSILPFLFFRTYNLSISPYYLSEDGEDSPFICSAPRENGMLRCSAVPPYVEGGVECSLPAHGVAGASVNKCINWNQYYNVCQPGEFNPHKGAVNFDNIGYAWIAIFQVNV